MRVAAHLGLEHLIRLTHVCSAWRRILCATGSMWTELDDVNLSHPGCVDRVRVIAGRAGRLSRLDLHVAPAEDSVLDRATYETLGWVLREVSQAAGGGKLKAAHLDLTE